MSRDVIESFQMQQLRLLAGSPVGRSEMTRQVIQAGEVDVAHRKKAEQRRRSVQAVAMRKRQLDAELKLRGYL